MKRCCLFAIAVLLQFGIAACSGDSEKGTEDLTTTADVVAGDDTAVVDAVTGEDGLTEDDVVVPPEDVVIPPEDVVIPPEDVVIPPEDVVDEDVPTCEPPTVDPNYVGVKKCLSCHAGMHPEIVAAWEKSGHNFKLNKVVDGVPPVYPEFATTWLTEDDFELLPGLGVTWNDIAYVIGGYGWKARFVGLDGYIITGDETNPGVQFNLETQKYSSYHTGEKKPYTCGTCHTTGWVAAEADCPPDAAMPGFLGVYSENTITCEACHGPGAEHAAAGNKALIGKGADACGKCHIRGTDMAVIPAKGGLTQHHEQYQEVLATGHKDIGCAGCHDAHASTKYDEAAPGEGVRTACVTCHGDVTVNDKHAGVATCVDCHMAATTKSAVSKTIGEGDDAVLYGDIAGHLFRLTTDADATLTYMGADEKEYTNNAVPVIYACKKCHAGKTVSEAIDGAALIHGN
jgi:hypothetical protein